MRPILYEVVLVVPPSFDECALFADFSGPGPNRSKNRPLVFAAFRYARGRVPIELPPDEAHLFYLVPDTELDQPGTLEPALRHGALYRQWMSADERARCDRYVFVQGRNEYTLTRALTRSVLSQMTGCLPNELVFAPGPHGKPRLVQPAGHLHFNVSNTRGLLMLLVMRDCEVGVDVENVTRHLAMADVAHRFFAPQEAAAMLALPPSQQPERFFTLWTLKEAYAKARGVGLSLPLDDFSFVFGSLGSLALAPNPQRTRPQTPKPGTENETETQAASRFSLGTFRLGENHLASWALQRRPEAATTLRLFAVCPSTGQFHPKGHPRHIAQTQPNNR